MPVTFPRAEESRDNTVSPSCLSGPIPLSPPALVLIACAFLSCHPVLSLSCPQTLTVGTQPALPQVPPGNRAAVEPLCPPLLPISGPYSNRSRTRLPGEGAKALSRFTIGRSHLKGPVAAACTATTIPRDPVSCALKPDRMSLHPLHTPTGKERMADI